MSLFINKYSYISPETSSPAQHNITGLVPLYRSLSIDYPKFFKMDNLSKLGFLAAELLLYNETPRFVTRDDTAIISFNKSSSLDTDILYQQTISKDNYYPSPSIFVYTLANIVTGEIAIRNKFTGETSSYLSPQWDAHLICRITEQTLKSTPLRRAIVSWLEYAENKYEAFMLLVTAEGNDSLPFTPEETDKLLKQLRNKHIIKKK